MCMHMHMHVMWLCIVAMVCFPATDIVLGLNDVYAYAYEGQQTITITVQDDRFHPNYNKKSSVIEL
jgi:hypothetical protein